MTSADADSHTGSVEAGQHGENVKNLSPQLEYEAAKAYCNELATKETAGSLVAILNRLRPGAYTAKYVACMKTKGYAVSQ